MRPKIVKVAPEKHVNFWLGPNSSKKVNKGRQKHDIEQYNDLYIRDNPEKLEQFEAAYIAECKDWKGPERDKPQVMQFKNVWLRRELDKESSEVRLHVETSRAKKPANIGTGENEIAEIPENGDEITTAELERLVKVKEIQAYVLSVLQYSMSAF